MITLSNHETRPVISYSNIGNIDIMNSSYELNITKTLWMDMTTGIFVDTSTILTQRKLILISFSALTALFHMIGVVVLVFLRSHLNHILIIMNLAIGEMVFCLTYTALSTFMTELFFVVPTVFSMLAIRLFMLILLADRFLEIYLNITYPITITRKKVFRLTCLVWVVSISYSLTQAMIVPFTETKSPLVVRIARCYYYHTYVLVFLDIIFAICAVITYSYFYYKIKVNISKDCAQRGSKTHKTKRATNFNFRIPFVIVGTYLAFNITSSIVFQYRKYKWRIVSEGHCASCLMLLDLTFYLQIGGYLCDAVVYIAMQKDVKKLFKRQIIPYEHR